MTYLKFILLILFINSITLVHTQETPEKISKYTTWNMKIRGYKTIEEYHYNRYGIISIGTSTTSIFTKYMLNTTSKIDLEISLLDHYKNNFYFTWNMLPSFSWDVNPVFYGFSMGFGGSFYDTRDNLGKGWLVGIDWENGFQIGLYGNTIDSQFHVFTGINVRGLYRSTSRVGVSIAFQIIYEYYLGTKEIYDKHGISIGPKIGILL